MELWLATGNKGKLNEFKNLLKGLDLDIHSQDELSYFSQPPEDGDSFQANALIKARALHALKPESWTVSDDSGLVVPGLDGLPGIHSARYAGPKAQPSENNAKLLKMVQIRCGGQREAHFECCLCVISPKGEEHFFSGKLDGAIAEKARGSSGFGYDPVFIPKGADRTLGEMTSAEKNSISHRSKALKKLLDHLKEFSLLK